MRLNQKTRVGLLIFGIGLLFLVAWRWGQNRAQNETPPPPPQATTVSAPAPGNQVAVARVDIPARTVITRDMLVMTDGSALSESDRNDRFVTRLEQIDGYVTNRVITRGTRIDRNADVVGHINDVSVSALINPGFRAMVIPLGNKQTLHNLVKVGDRVDIVAAFDGQESRTIVQDRRVLAVDVFVDDFPTRSIARKGGHKAPPRGDSAPAPAPAPDGQPAAPGAAPTPTPAPNNGQPIPDPEASLTLEVMPQDAVAISLALNSSAALDYVIRPRDAGTVVAEARVAAVNKAVLAPYADRKKGGAAPAPAAKPAASATGGGGGNRGRGNNFQSPSWPAPEPPQQQVAPIAPGSLESPKPPTYDIPIYGDGKMVRIDTVRKPEGSY